MRWSLAVLLIIIIGFIPYIKTDIETVSAGDGSELSRQLTAILANPKLDGALAGVSVRSAESGNLLFERSGDTRLRPASNMKLLTAAAALEHLGGDYRFKTEVYTDGKKLGSILNGNIYIKGYGDATLLEKDFDKLAKEVKKSGIKAVTGHVIADDKWYDDERYSLDLAWSDEYEYYGAAISALTASPNEDYDAGTVIVEVNPAEKAGKSAAVTLTPYTDHVKIENRAKTVAADGKKDITIKREHGTNTIVIEGTIPLKASQAKEWIAVWEPTGYAADLFENALKKQGIKLSSKVKTGVTPAKAKLVTVHESMTLNELLIPFMKLSNNTIAEMLIKEMGRKTKGEGSWDAGLDAVENTLKEHGINTATLLLRDGSGLSPADLIPASEQTKLLFELQKEHWFDEYLNALPIAGESDRMVGGTLRNRMKNTAAEGNVHAKTGTISAVSTLTGYVTGKSGERYIFSVMLNNFTSSSGMTAIQDEIAILLANQ